MIEIKVVSQNGEILFSEKGQKIDTVYKGEYSEGDKIVITKNDTEYLALKLDETLEERSIFVKSGAFEFPIPWG